MTTSNWRKKSRDRIYETLLEVEAQALCDGKQLDEKTAIAAISKAYPFVGRESHPYKQWLREVKIAKAFLKTKDPARLFMAFAERYERGKRSQVARIGKPSPGQLDLLGGAS